MNKKVINKIKAVLSKLKVGSEHRKNIIKLRKDKQTISILEVLQKKGCIYGYSVYSLNSNYLLVFLKNFEGNVSILSSLSFLNQQNKKINKSDINSLFFVVRNKSFFLENGFNNKLIFGVFVAKL